MPYTQEQKDRNLQLQLELQTDNLKNNHETYGQLLVEQCLKNLETLKANDFTGMFDCASDDDEDAYHIGVGFSRSQIQDANKSLMRFHWRNRISPSYNPRPKGGSPLAIGDLVHKAILEPSKVMALYEPDGEIVTAIIKEKPETKNVTATAAYKGYAAGLAAGGKTLMRQKDWNMVQVMLERVRNHPVVKNVLVAGQSEKMIYSRDPETGLLCRCKPDFIVSDGLLIDLKTTVSADAFEFSKKIWDFRYHLQAAFYQAVAKWAGLPCRDHFVFVALEKEEPFDLAVFMLDIGAIDKGQAEYRYGLDRLAHALNTKEFPGYQTDIQTISLPPWAWTRD